MRDVLKQQELKYQRGADRQVGQGRPDGPQCPAFVLGIAPSSGEAPEQQPLGQGQAYGNDDGRGALDPDEVDRAEHPLDGGIHGDAQQQRDGAVAAMRLAVCPQPQKQQRQEPQEQHRAGGREAQPHGHRRHELLCYAHQAQTSRRDHEGVSAPEDAIHDGRQEGGQEHRQADDAQHSRRDISDLRKVDRQPHHEGAQDLEPEHDRDRAKQQRRHRHPGRVG